MTRRKSLTDLMVAKLKPTDKRQNIPDPELRGHYVRVTPGGAKSYAAVAREPHKGKQIWATIGPCDRHSIAEAREKVRAAIKRIKAGLPPFEAPPEQPDTFKTVAENYVKRHVKAKGIRSEGEIERILKRYVYPEWEGRAFLGIGRGDVTALLDRIEDNHGARQADTTLTVIRAIMNFQATRTDNYVPPIVRGMRRDAAKPRERVLTDEEVRLIWTMAAGNGIFGAIVRLALSTGQRRERIATMKWADVDLDAGVWHIPPPEAREKGNGGDMRLPDRALDIIRAQKKIGDNPYVFPGRRGGHFSGWSPCKRRLDERVVASLREAAVERGNDPDEVKPLPRWTVHDLRRTSRSLMARAGVREFVAERVLGHAQPGVRGIYDRHGYFEEKGAALDKLAALVETIINPPEGNVVAIHG